jgi:spore germination cell wall hydrolase CwlJ-like protein
MIAVGTVVMNRLRSGQHGSTVCAVVGERRQFAPGVMTRRMNSRAMPDVEAAAESVLRGERAPKLKNAMHFHTAGLKFPYKNMHYVEVAGGNAFYEKRGRNWKPLPPETTTMVAFAGPAPATAATAAPTMVASAEPAAVALPVISSASSPVVASFNSSGQMAAGETSNATAALAASAPVPTPRTVAMAAPQSGKQDRAVQLAMQEPDNARFGASDFDTAKKSAPVMAAAVQNDAQQPAMSFQSTPDDTNAIGALIMSESRPMNE